MKNVLKILGDWFTSQVIFIITSSYVAGIAPIILSRRGIIPESEMILGAYWVAAVMSVVVIAFTLLRWLTKYPAPLTWLSAALGVVSVNTLVYSYTTLKRFYAGEEGMPSSTIATLAVVVVLLAMCAAALTRKAWANRFNN